MKQLSRIVLGFDVPEPTIFFLSEHEKKMSKEDVLQARWLRAAEEMGQLLKRRMDDLKISDRRLEHKCSFCGASWTEDSSAYNGGCCDKDEEANPAALTEKDRQRYCPPSQEV